MKPCMQGFMDTNKHCTLTLSNRLDWTGVIACKLYHKYSPLIQYGNFTNLYNPIKLEQPDLSVLPEHLQWFDITIDFFSQNF